MDKQTLQRLLVGELSIKRLIYSLIFIYTFFCLYVFFVADSKIFLPQPSSYSDTSDILKLATHDQIQLSAVYLPNPASKYTILYVHGNAEDLGDIQLILRQLRDIGFSVFAYDYRGYGTSQGKPSERTAYRDIETAYNYLIQQLTVPAQRIIAFGRSVGGGSVVDLAARKPIAGLILESSFTTAFRVVLPFPILPFDKFRNIDKIKKVTRPVLVMHGKADNIIPFQHGEKLFAAANGPKLSLWVERADHNDFMWVAGEQYADILRKFAQLVEQTQRQA
jgi:abhydrolase domain-containing protein 17